MVNNLETIHYADKFFNVDQLTGVINLKSSFFNVFNSSISDTSIEETKAIENEIVTIEKSLEPFIRKLKVAKNLKSEEDFMKKNPKYFTIMAFAKSAFSLAVIGAGILTGTAAVVFLGPLGILLASAIGLATWIISSFIGAGYAYQAGFDRVLDAEMGIMVLGPIAPLIPLLTCFFREKQISNHLTKFETEKNEFEKTITDHVDLVNQHYPIIQERLNEEIEKLIHQLKTEKEGDFNLDNQIKLANGLKCKLELLKFVQTYYSSLNDLMKSDTISRK